MCVLRVCAPPGRVSTLVCTQAREQPRLALAREIRRHSTQSTLSCSGNSLCPPKALSETTWLASTYSHTTAMSTVRTEAGGAQGKAQAGNCLLLSVPITVHEQEWNGVRWPVFEVHASETARVFQQRAARRMSRFHGAHRETQTPDGCAPTPWCRVRERQGRVTYSVAGRGMVFTSGSESMGTHGPWL